MTKTLVIYLMAMPDTASTMVCPSGAVKTTYS